MAKADDDLINISICQQADGKMFNDFHCFDQSCGQERGLCGLKKMKEHFKSILSQVGHRNIEYFEHAEVTFLKPDQKQV